MSDHADVIGVDPARMLPADIDATPLIELDHATVIRAGVRVLDDISMHLQLGRHAAIIGPNGCGKSTLVKLIHRELYPLARATDVPPIRLFGEARWNVADLRTRLGIVSADLQRDLIAMRTLDAEEVVLSGFWSSFGVPPHRHVEPGMRERALQSLADMDALALRQRRLDTLSTGEARRVMIARALVQQPQALLLDEPSAGLDVRARRQLLAMLSRLAARGTTLVLVTHHLEEVIPEIEQVILLKRGRLFDQGAPSAMLSSERLSALFDAPMQVHVSNDGVRTLLA